jgi:signal transduction histidine kinase/CheY-like chemotaxis protein
VALRGLTARLSLGIVLLVLLSVGLMASLAVWRSAGTLRGRALASNLAVAVGVSRAVERHVADTVAIMAEAASRPKLRSEISVGNWPEARTVLENIARHFPQLSYVFAQDPRGVIRARVPDAGTVGEDFSSRDFFQEATRTRRPYVSGVYLSRATGQPTVAIAAPVLDLRRGVTGLVVGALSLDAINLLVSAHVEEGDRAVYVVDGRGHLVASSRGRVTSLVDVSGEPIVRAGLAGPAGSVEVRGPDGARLLGAHAPIGRLGWAVAVAWPTAAAQAPAVSLGVALLGIALGCTAAAIVVGVGFARLLTRPLVRLEQASRRIAAGEPPSPVDARGPTEVRTLAGALNRMAEAVDRSHRALAERAAEAEQTNRQLTEEMGQRVEAEAALRRQADRLAGLHEIDRGILAAHSPAEIAEAALRHLRRLVRAPRAALARYDLGAGEAIWLAVDVESRSLLAAGVRFPLRLMGDLAALQRGEVQIVEVDSLGHLPQTAILEAEGIRSYGVVPLVAQGELIGSLNLGAREPGGPPASDLAVAREVGDQLAIALRQARLAEELRSSYDDLQQTQGQLAQAQKMEAIGQLAGGVAHDFNNLLTVIAGRSHLALEQLPAEHPLRRHIELIKTTTDRAAALTRQLLAFSRKQVLEPKVLDLNALVTGVMPMLQRLLGEDIELATVPAERLGRVKADPSQLEQVILNLAVNARDAMPQGGILTVETANADLDEAYAKGHAGATPGAFVMLAVSDTGHGMDADTRARIFEPFFTTKAQGKGTGLGLATVFGIVKQSGGNIWVYSEPGHGTTFKVYLPRVAEALTAAAPASTAPVPPRGSETVLLVEDDEEVRALARETLEAGGYTVIPAAGPSEALRLAADGSRPIDLLLTDVVLPQLSGRGLADRLSADHRELRLLYMSGYTDEAIVRHGVLAEGVAFLQKPFTPYALLAKIREVLDRPL